MKVTYQNSAMHMRLEMTGMIVNCVTDHRKKEILIIPIVKSRADLTPIQNIYL